MRELLGPELLEFLTTIVRLSLWLALLVAVFVPLERLFAVHPRQAFRRQLGPDLGYYFLNSLAPALLLSAPVAVLAWLVHRFIPVSVLNATAAWPLWARALAGLIVGEIGYYWGHRWSHQVPFLWRFHAVHHSAPQVDFLVNTRAHPFDMVFSRFCGLAPMTALGLGGPLGPADSLAPVLATLLGTGWGFFIHSNLRWRFGPLEWLVSTPAFHHWHHTRSGPINRNYSSTLPWLDALFGTLYLPNEWPADYGIKSPMPETLLGQLAAPLYEDEPPTPASAASAEQARQPMAGDSVREPAQPDALPR